MKMTSSQKVGMLANGIFFKRKTFFNISKPKTLDHKCIA